MSRPSVGRVFFFDTSLLGSGSEAWARLRNYADDGWIELRRATAVSDDLARDRDADRVRSLENEGSYPEMLGVFVWNESRWDSAVWASNEESSQFKRLFTLVFSGTDPSSTSRTASNKRRDVMHLHTTLKYGADGFITRDTALLSKGSLIEQEFGLAVFDPERALAFVDRLILRFERRQQR